MKNTLQSLLLLLSICFLSSCEQVGKTYYINSLTGNDLNNGQSENQAFATLQKANSLILKAGDQLLFKSGTSYKGQLKPKGEGTTSAPIIIGKYGGDEQPTIHGCGKYKTTVHIYNMQHLVLKDLEITNTGEKLANGRRGLIIEAEDFGVAKQITIENLFIHGVNGSLIKKDGGGSAILWKNHGKKLKTKFDNLIIQNCHLKNCTRNGINAKGYSSRDNWYPSTNVIVRNNLLEKIPGDGIVPIATDGAIIEHNIMRDCPDLLPFGDAAPGIWPWSADNTLIQFNEVSGHKAKWDGQGFDSDYNCQGTIIQYNYSHDNYGGFLLVCNAGKSLGQNWNMGTKNSIIRYNISINDGIRPYETQPKGMFSPTIHISGPCDQTYIHHNIFIIPQKTSEVMDRTFVCMDNWGGPWPDKTAFIKNYFKITQASRFAYEKSKNNFAQNNVFDTNQLNLKENDSKIPDWLKGKMKEKVDNNFIEKLIAKFFKNDDKRAMELRTLVAQ